ncbi:peptide chain release factor H [Diaphorobacter aerolatus]|uniref:Peptide chain release factor H n=1 Tax=Diaphorobacter aerolatus TaxID=1288495 RepID=A0A7H0GGZ3_9BURK|nr:peptide chain release factor H [Diaphorobacter aerolatus]QNP47559.1 peptide chain release factor H [Diaphorobacter aerolatus]
MLLNNTTLVQITAAQGPSECERAVAVTLRAMLRDALRAEVQLHPVEENATVAGFKSVLLQVQGAHAHDWLLQWEGTVQCVFASPFRPGHRRKNWFVGIRRCDVAEDDPALDDRDLRFQACRASGKGGQHVNTTDSAVHATHLPSGISVKVMTERSQHANKRLARALIAMKLAELAQQNADLARRDRNQQHGSLERGNPVRVLRE